MTIDVQEFREYLKIDKYKLDTMLERQASLFYEVAEAYAEATSICDSLKDRLAEVDADLDNRVRVSAGDEKITEGDVKAQIASHKLHKAASTAYLKAKAFADKLKNLKEAFNQRNYMLRELAGLYTSNYFENQSLRGDANTDRATYMHKRERLANARSERSKE